ncbi:inhibitor of the pro-sigma K processing machinery [Thermosyntropha lipolytica DSM 11003]|uniref:Inhibitor of the pro-sigma K processing machinery n=1 Tax=Thermosyntropha lipolytica DSM 11003 TaxID=1123382 RepID=A0A1M5R9Q7_9FIRM|nr:pro-sigmaK processing inhibitor BofA family protein [Thermosyntropha lipolytica]SHH23065.1 inhibitor of the pro-sigma K processing machinery [Thermosyntropha lipolytica DSM 11003]
MEILNIVMAAVLLLVIIYIITQVVLKPIKILGKLIINSVLGLILLIVTNYIGAFFAFKVAINLLTVLIAGFLGIPGVLLLICFQMLLK